MNLMAPRNTVIFLGDGMADEPLPALDGKTPIQVADTPAMDRIAKDGRSGDLSTLPEGFPTSSEVANMSVLGCDLQSEYCGRGPLEARGRGVELAPNDVAFRVNLTTVQDGTLLDFSGDHVAQEVADELVDALNSRLGTDAVRFHAGVSYRNILVLSGSQFSPRITTDKPDDNHGELVANHLPRADAPEAEPTAELLRSLILNATEVLEQAPANRALKSSGEPVANGIWPWSGGRTGALRQLQDKYGVKGAVISAVDVINGLGLALGMDVISVDGATGYTDTNFEGKADAAVCALRDYDLVYLHVEAIDVVSHAQDLEKKIAAIEAFDRRTIDRLLQKVGPDVSVAVLADHPVPVTLGKHTRTPVPVAVRMSGHAPDAVTSYDEVACPSGSLGHMSDGDLMRMLFG